MTITKLLSQDFDDELDALGFKVGRKHRVALSEDNDPFAGHQRSHVAFAKWFAKWFDHFRRQGAFSAAHIRRIHYALISQPQEVWKPGSSEQDYVDAPVWVVPSKGSKKAGQKTGDERPNLYLNDNDSWVFLNTAAKWARYFGLVDADLINDHRSPDPMLFSGRSIWELEAATTTPPDSVSTPHLYAGMVPTTPGLVLPERAGYAAIAPNTHHIEIWSEKSTLNDVLLPICRRHGINLVTSVGEPTLTQVNELFNRAGRRPIRVMHLGDYDPAGKSMSRALARKLEWYLRNHLDADGELADAQVIRIGLTTQQIRQYKLPPVKIKSSEKRAAVFNGCYGSDGVELDALLAIAPGALESIIIEALSPFIECDAKFQRDLAAIEQEYRTDAQALVTEIKAEHAEDLDPLVTQLRQAQAELRELMDDAIAEYLADTAEAREAHAEIMSAMTDELADRLEDIEEVTQPDSISFDDPLLDSRRSYGIQLLAYNRYDETFGDG